MREWARAPGLQLTQHGSPPGQLLPPASVSCPDGRQPRWAVQLVGGSMHGAPSYSSLCSSRPGVLRRDMSMHSCPSSELFILCPTSA